MKPRLWAGLVVVALLAGVGLYAFRANVRPALGRLLPGLEAQHAWAPGACQTLAPIGRDRQQTVFIDPGHGSPDPGTSGVSATGQRVYEKDLTLATALRLAAVLRADGYRVVLSRVRDMSVARLSAADVSRGVYSVAGDHNDLVARVDCANASHAAVLLSLHFNAFSDPSVGGVETFYDDARPFSAQNQRLAALVQQNVLAQFGQAGLTIPDRGTAPDSSDAAPALSQAAAAYHHLLELGPAQPGYLDLPSSMPGVLCEPLFLTDPPEAAVAASADGQYAMAHGLALAIEQFLTGAGTP
ncbi:MAG: N-acetylmuramoyl-L-alanine amidase family protein [Dehalococcoidia bacterium]